MPTYQYPPIPEFVAAVSSVNGETGAVILSAADVGAASTTLNNLGTTAINLSLIPAADDTINLGANGKAYNTLYIATNILKSGGSSLWDISGNRLMSAGGTPGILLDTRVLTDGFVAAVNWGNRALINDSSNPQLSWNGANVNLGAGLSLLAQSADTTSPVAGTLFYDTDIGKIKVYNGVGWEVVTSV